MNSFVNGCDDGPNRRVIEESGSGVNHLLDSQGWQVLEEREDSSLTPHTRTVYSPVQIDAVITITRDSDANGSLDQRLWVVQDSNWNVTALLNDSGIVVERYAYDAYGAVTFLDVAWAVKSGGSDTAIRPLWQGLRLDDASGLYHARNREVSATLGRPLQRDPIGFAARDVNVYRWLGNGPTGAVDPLGLQEIIKPRLERYQWMRSPDIDLSNKGQYAWDWYNPVLDDAPFLFSCGVVAVGATVLPIPGGKLVELGVRKGWKLTKNRAGNVIGFFKSDEKKRPIVKSSI